MNLKEVVELMCRREGKTLSSLAEEMGVRQPTLHNILTNGNPLLSTVSRIAKALKTKPSTIVAMVADDE